LRRAALNSDGRATIHGFPPAVRAAFSIYGAGKSALEQAEGLRLNQQRQLKNTDQKNTQHPICVASAAVCNETGNFNSKTAFEGTPPSGVSESVL